MEAANAAQNSAVEVLLTPEQREQLAAAGIASGLIAGLIKAFLSALLANLPNLIGAIPSNAPRPNVPPRK